jgi:hypothetical protein
MTTPSFAVCLFDHNNRCEVLAHVAARDTVDAANKAIPIVVAEDFREAVTVSSGFFCGSPYAEISFAESPLFVFVLPVKHAERFEKTVIRTATYML